MKRKIAFVLALLMAITLCSLNNLSAYAEDWKLPEETQMYKPGRTMSLEFGSLTVLDVGFAKEAQSIIQGTHVGYYTARDGQVLFAFKGLLFNSSDQPITLESLKPIARFHDSEPVPVYGYPAVAFGIPEYYTLEPETDVEIVFQCTVPDGLYHDSGDILLEFAGGSMGFKRADLGNYNSVGFTAEDGKPVGELTEVPAVQEEGIIVANQPHVDEVRGEDISLEFDSQKDKYRIHVKIRNITGYPTIHDKLPQRVSVNMQFLDANGDVLREGAIRVGSSVDGSLANLIVGQAGWDNTPNVFVSKAVVDSAKWVRFSSYTYHYGAVNSDGSAQSVDGTFTDPLVIPLSDILPDRKPIANEDQLSDEARFVLRSGIMFGDSRQAVKEKEVFSLSETLSGNNLAGKGTIVGCEDTGLSYYFDDSNGLKEMLYDFKRLNSKDESDRRYETIYNGLVQKYGEPLDLDGNVLEFYTKAFTMASGKLNVAKFTCEISDFGEFAQWLVEDGDDYVIIDLVSCYWVSDKSYFDLNLGYMCITKDEMNSAIERGQYDHSNDL